MLFAPRTRPDRYTILEHLDLAESPDPRRSWELRRCNRSSELRHRPSGPPAGGLLRGQPGRRALQRGRIATARARSSAYAGQPGRPAPDRADPGQPGARPGRLGRGGRARPLAAAGDCRPGLLGLVALLAWQLAYAFDCADGQLARVTGRTSSAGARVDVLCDVAAQIGAGDRAVGGRGGLPAGTPAWLVAAFAGTWMVNLVTSVMQSGPNAASMVPSQLTSGPDGEAGPRLRGGRPGRRAGADHRPTMDSRRAVGVHRPVNGLFLLASIAFTARPAARLSPL